MSSLASSGDWPENFKQLKTIDDLLRCPICYEYFDITMIIPQCSHNYCSLCIRRYLNYKTQCPTCGVSVSEPELRNNRSLDDLVRQFLDVRPSLLQCVKSGVNSHTADRGSTSGPAGSKPDTSMSTLKKITSSKAGKSSEAATTGVKKSPPTNTLDRFCSTVGTRTVPAEDDDQSDDFRDDVKRHRGKRISYKESSSDDDVEIVGTVVTPPPVKPTKVPSPKASTSQESTPAGERNNSSQVAMADCPVCGVSIPERHINNHLDVCLTREEKKESLRSSAPKRKPMAKLVYNLMSDKDLRKRLKEKGLSNQGDRQTLIARHHEFVLRYNSQCDSAEPKSVAQIVKEVEKHERVLSKTTVTKPTFTLNKTSNEQERDRVNTKYATEHKAQFNSLIENARKRMKQKRKAKLAEEGPEITAEEKLPSMEVDSNIATDEPTTEKPTEVSNEREKTVEDSLTVQKGDQASTEEDQEDTVEKEDLKEHTEDPVEEKSNPVQTPDAPQFNLLAEFDDIDEDNTLCTDDTRDDPADDCNSEKSVSLFDNIQQDTRSGEQLQEDQLTGQKSETEPVRDTESEDDEEDTLTPSLEFGASEGSVDILAMKPYQLQDPTYAQSSSSGPSSIADFDFLGDDPEIKCVPESPPARQLRRGKRKVAELQSDSDGSFGSEQDVRRSKRRTTNRNKNH